MNFNPSVVGFGVFLASLALIATPAFADQTKAISSLKSDLGVSEALSVDAQRTEEETVSSDVANSKDSIKSDIENDTKIESEVQADITDTPTVDMTENRPETQIEKLQAVRRNAIKQKLEALYDNTPAPSTKSAAPVAHKEKGLKGFFHSIIKLFE